jgi:para-aminobenzoate synthetase
MYEGTRPPLRTLLIDNHDSFTLNLFHLLARVNGREPLLVPNDWDGWDPQVLETVDSVVLSPGPGTPLRSEDVGICAEAVAAARVPVLGICLGHQLIAHLHGAHVGRAPEPRHGRVSAIEHDGTGLFAGIPAPFSTVRYHSLAATEVVEPLRITARSEDGVVQGLEHSTLPLWGVQFHPESILTEHGETLLENFAQLTRDWHAAKCAEAAAGDRIATSDQAATGAPASTQDEPTRPIPIVRTSVPYAGDAASLFDAVHGDDPCAVLLDGNLPGDSRGRVSILGAPTGSHGRIAEARVAAGTVTISGVPAGTPSWDGNVPAGTDSADSSVTDGSSGAAENVPAGTCTDVGNVPAGTLGTTVIRSGLFDWLEAELRRFRVDPADLEGLPSGFGLGWVGNLGYELAAECGGPAPRPASGPGGKATGTAPFVTPPDATLVFLDRAVLVDAQEGTVHLLALDWPEDPGGATAWLEAASAAVTEAGTRTVQSDAAREPSSSPEGVSAPEAASVPGHEGVLTDSSPDDRDRAAARAARSGVVARVTREEYLAQVRAAQDLIRDGETYEACLTTQYEGPVTALGIDAPTASTDVSADRAGTDPLWDVYLRMRQDNPAPFGAYLRLPGATVLSVSPERFLRIDATGHVESSPIKGTRPRGATPEEDAELIEDLATSEKDRSENLMIVDLVRHDLGRTAVTGSVRVPTLFGVETYASVHQLVSTVTAQLHPDASPVACVRAAFPPGSMTGAPKRRTLQILDALEQGPRGVYSGAIGWFSLTGAVDLSVVIRTLVVTGDRLSYGVGGAIVALSDPAAEHDETLVKARPLLRLIDR